MMELLITISEIARKNKERKELEEKYKNFKYIVEKRLKNNVDTLTTSIILLMNAKELNPSYHIQIIHVLSLIEKDLNKLEEALEELLKHSEYNTVANQIRLDITRTLKRSILPEFKAEVLTYNVKLTGKEGKHSKIATQLNKFNSYITGLFYGTMPITEVKK